MPSEVRTSARPARRSGFTDLTLKPRCPAAAQPSESSSPATKAKRWDSGRPITHSGTLLRSEPVWNPLRSNSSASSTELQVRAIPSARSPGRVSGRRPSMTSSSRTRARSPTGVAKVTLAQRPPP